jgi:hypothetical protein
MTNHRKIVWLAAAVIGCFSAGCKKANTSSGESEPPDAAASDPTPSDDADSPSEEGAPAPEEECTEEHAAMGHCTRDDAPPPP